ncbi:MAG: helix-turn-helix transcriptional regulator [Sphingobacteriales bacterium]|nr:helix-turn-helix transcriptional regulator [Sphingobacteriales bacterium]
MIPEFIRLGRSAVKMQPVTGKSIQRWLPGSTVHTATDKNASLEAQSFHHPFFNIGYRIVRFFRTFRLTVRERNESIRLEAVLSGELPGKSPEGQEITLKAGQYHLSVHPEVTALFKKDTACHYFVTHYSKDLLNQIGVSDMVKPCRAKSLSEDMQKVIHSISRNPYQEKILTFHHDNCIRELLLLHLTNHTDPLKGNLSDDDIAAIYAADAILQQDLKNHDDIPTLAEKAGINEFKLKKGFRQEFNMGVFERLTYHRMEYAKVLLKTTNRTMDDVASLVGYGSRNAFITAFKNKIGVTPKKWKVKLR